MVRSFIKNSIILLIFSNLYISINTEYEPPIIELTDFFFGSRVGIDRSVWFIKISSKMSGDRSIKMGDRLIT